jgi:hypothetical protein
MPKRAQELNQALEYGGHADPWELPAVGLGFCWTGTIQGDAEMIRELFLAFMVLIITVAATAWLNGGPRLSAQQVQVEASLAK